MDALDFLKKVAWFGVGTAVFSAEKLKEFADEMVQKGELSTDDAKKLLEDISKRAEEEKNRTQEWFKEQADKIKNTCADTERVKKLEERVAALEAKLSLETNGADCCSKSDDEENKAEN